MPNLAKLFLWMDDLNFVRQYKIEKNKNKNGFTLKEQE
jgi:hypothetical protein